jgi:hypothetical protein
MRDKHGSGVASTDPFHRSGPMAADPRTDRTKTDLKQRDRAANGTRAPMPSVQAFDVLLAADLTVTSCPASHEVGPEITALPGPSQPVIVT